MKKTNANVIFNIICYLTMNIIDLIQLRLKVYVINMDDNHKNSEELKGETRYVGK